MLKTFRNRKSFGWIFGAGLLVLVIFAFVAFYIPDFFGPQTAGTPTGGDVAWVNGDPISAQNFIQSYRSQEQAYRQQMGDNANPQLMRQLGLDNMVVQQMIQDKVLLREAEKQGLHVHDDEVTNAIVELPFFQNDGGQFIGKQAYLQRLQGAAVTVSKFEGEIRESLLRDKLQQMVMQSSVIGEKELRDEYARRNNKTSIEYVVVPRAEFEPDVEIDDAAIAAYFESNQEKFRRPLQRKLSYLTMTNQLFAVAVEVNEREIVRYYQENGALFETPEQVQASHILFKTDGDKDVETVRLQAEEILNRVKAGEDFSALATEFSEDTSASNGGDLGLFGRGQMVPEFEEVAFSLPEGTVSELVRTNYGFHIIKVEDHQTAVVQPIESARDRIRGTLIQEKATGMLEDAVASAQTRLRSSGSLELLANEYERLATQESQFFSRDQTLAELGNSREAVQLAFELPIGRVSRPIRLSSGYAFIQVKEERESAIPELDEVTPRVRQELIESTAMDRARAKAEALRSELADGAPDGVEVKTNESFFAGTTLPDLGRSAVLQQEVFNIPLQEYSDPLPGENGYALVRVLERTSYEEDDFVEQAESFREQIKNERSLRFWNAYLEELQSNHEVRVDWQLIRDLTS